MLTTSVNNFRSMFEDMSQMVEDIIDTESRIVSYNLPKSKKTPKPVMNLDTTDLLLTQPNISEKLRITMEERMPPSRFSSFIPDQIPKIKLNNKQKRRRRTPSGKRAKKSIDPLKEFLDDELYKSPVVSSKSSRARSIKPIRQDPPSPVPELENELPLCNPFLSDECCLDDTDLEEVPPVPLTMYSFFQFPLEEDIDSFSTSPLDDCTNSDYSELDSLYSTSSSSSESESILNSPPPSNLCHLAAYSPLNSDFSLSPRFKLRLSRDKLIASIDQRERAYLITYANQLLESRSQISLLDSQSTSNDDALSTSSKLTSLNSLYFDETEDLRYTGSYIRDLNGMCTPLTKAELELKEERNLVLKHLDNYVKGRDIRGNSLGWLMLSLEFRMINSKYKPI